MINVRSLREIALDSGSDKEGVHFYADLYERHFGSHRFDPVTLLEIGVGGYEDPLRGGESLRMWKEFFPNGHIVGFDIHDKTKFSEDRVTILRGDQSDARFLEDVARRFGPFDFIVDDGSHVCADVVASFRGLFDHLKDGGVYAIEDLCTSYWPQYLGSSGRGRRRGTSMTFLKELADGLNHAEYDVAHYRATTFDEWISSITFYQNLVFIQKGANRQPSIVLPPHPRRKRQSSRVGLYRLRYRLRSRAGKDDVLGRTLASAIRAYRRRRYASASRTARERR